MTTFTTTIIGMRTVQQPDPNYVVNVEWTMTGVDGEYTASNVNNTILDSTQQSGPFIPYDQLTPEIVMGWIPASDIACAQANVQGHINSLINPPVTPQNAALPWAPAA